MAAALATCAVATMASAHALRRTEAGPPAPQTSPAARPDGAGTVSEDGLLAIVGTIVLPDGTPAAGATLVSTTEADAPSRSTRADGPGCFRLKGRFGNGAHLYASSADGRHQAILWLPYDAVRTASASPVGLKLGPTNPQVVTVLAEGGRCPRP